MRTRPDGPRQLDFEDAYLRLVARAPLPNVGTPVVRWRKLARRVDPPPGSPVSASSFQLVAGILADYADRNGENCRPRVATIAAEARLNKRTVQRALAALEQRALIERDARGGRRATRYRLVLPVEQAGEQAGDSAAGDDEGVSPVSPQGCQPCHPRSASEDRQEEEASNQISDDLWKLLPASVRSMIGGRA